MFKVVQRIAVIVAVLTILALPHVSIAQVAPTASASITGNVADSNGKPVANATVTVQGPKNTSTQTDSYGSFVFVGLPLGTYSISTTAPGLGTATRSAIAVQGDINVAIQFEPATGLKTIGSVSTRVNASFNVTPASVTEVSPRALAFQGQTSWRKILEQVPGVAQAGLVSGRSSYSVFPDGPLVPMQISINGALPYETATLLDDMPLIGLPGGNTGFAAGSGTDLSLYPLNSFAAADIVRGPGAAAPSILDSVGGSFVLHPPGAVRANHYEFSFSTDPYGGVVANGSSAVRLGNLSTNFTYGVNDSPGPLRPNFVPAITVFRPSAINGVPFVCSGTCAQTNILNPVYAGFPIYGFNTGLLVCCSQQSSAWNQHGGSVALHWAASPWASAEIFYAGQVANQSLPNPTYTVNFTPPADYGGTLPAGQNFLSAAGGQLAYYPRANVSTLLEEKVTAQVGSGLLRFAALQNRTNNVFGPFTLPSPVKLQLFGGGTLGGTPTTFNGQTYTVTFPPYVVDERFGSNNRDVLISYSAPLGQNLRAGASFVRSYYNMPFTEIINFGGFLINASTPPDVSQTANEFRIFAGMSPSAKTTLDLSGYFTTIYDHVQNPNDATGSTYVDKRYRYSAPRLGFVWRPTPTVAIRAATGGGFAQAPLSVLAGGNFGFTPSGTPRLGPGGTFYQLTLTNLDLQPETSFGFDVGADVRLGRSNTVVSMDLYHTTLYGQLYNSTVTGTYNGLPLYTTEYGNFGQSRYEGVLLDARNETAHGMYWKLSGGLTRAYAVSLPAGLYNVAGSTCNVATNTGCKNQNVVTGINFNSTFTQVSVPYAQGLGTLGYRWAPKTYVELVGTYYGNNNTYFRPAFAEWDARAEYALGKNLSLLLNFRNITGIYGGSTQTYTPASFMGAPTIAGNPFPEWGEEYGPRAAILTMRISL